MVADRSYMLYAVLSGDSSFCAFCNTPLFFQEEMVWSEGGVICLRRDPIYTLAILDLEALTEQLDSQRKRYGAELERIAMNAKADVSAAFTSTISGGLRGFLLRKFFIKQAFNKSLIQGLFLGYGAINIYENNRDKMVKGSARNPYVDYLFIGDSLGMFRGMTRCDADVSWDESDGAALFNIVAKGKKIKIQKDKRPLITKSLSQPNPNLPRCPECGLPEKLSRFSWDLSNGTINDIKSQQRNVFMGVAGLRSIFDTLAADEIESTYETYIRNEMNRVSRQLSRRNIEPSVTAYYRILMQVQLRGMGAVDNLEHEDKTLDITIRNPYYPPFLVGLVAGIYNALENATPSIKWTSRIVNDRELLHIQLQPAP